MPVGVWVSCEEGVSLKAQAAEVSLRDGGVCLEPSQVCSVCRWRPPVLRGQLRALSCSGAVAPCGAVRSSPSSEPLADGDPSPPRPSLL